MNRISRLVMVGGLGNLGAISTLLILPFIAGCAAPKIEGAIGCDLSPIEYAATPYETGHIGRCQRRIMEHQSEDPFGNAFQPGDTLSYFMDFHGVDEDQYAQLYLAIAKPGVHLKEAEMRTGVSEIVYLVGTAFPPSWKVAWGEHAIVAGYEVDFYDLNKNDDKGALHCMAFVRYLDGTPRDHTKQNSGRYCKSPVNALGKAEAEKVLGNIRIREELINWQEPAGLAE